MAGTNCLIVDTEFPADVLLKMDEYKLAGVPDGFSFYFMCDVLPYQPGWLSSLKRKRQLVIDRQDNWIVSSEVVDRSDTLIEYGVGTSRSKASDVSAFRLFSVLERRNPGFFMPEFLIGYPNVRGHCFLISAIMPLMHSYPFLVTLLRVQRRLNIERNRGETKAGDENKVFRLVERDYYWCDLLFKMHLDYQKIARKGSVASVNEPLLARRVVRGNSPVVGPDYVKPDCDVRLDNDLIRGLATSLRNFCDSDYSDAGGDERLAYRNILCKLASEDKSFYEACFICLDIEYTCSGCTGGPFAAKFRLPFLLSDCGVDFTELVSNLSKSIKKQGLLCPRIKDGYVCGERLHLFLRSEIINVPKIICIATQNGIKVISVPERLNLEVNGKEYEYELFGSSKCFECFKDENGVSYGEYYREPLETDESEGWHTYPVIRTESGFVEVNNGILYSPDKQIQWRTTPGALHFYQKKCYYRFKPKIDYDYLYENPGNVNE